VTSYLDTSSLVKLYVAESESDAVRQLVESADIVATAAIAYPEARAALARRRREGGLRPRAFAAATRALDEDWPRYLAVDVTAALCRGTEERTPASGDDDTQPWLRHRCYRPAAGVGTGATRLREIFHEPSVCLVMTFMKRPDVFIGLPFGGSTSTV